MKPEMIIIEKHLSESESVGRILSRLEGVPVTSTTRFWLSDVTSLENDYQAHVKNVVKISGRTGGLARRCPGERGMLCCSYFVLDVVLGCPADCHYCILQDVLSNLPVTINADIQGILDELAGFLATRKNVFTRIGTGELSDSLMLDGITHFAERAVPFFAGQPHAVLELKTKGSSVDVLAQLEGRGRTIVSMSLAPQVLIDRYENGTALLGKRIEAASRCVSWGYPVGFHFDPIILENGWEEAYAGVVDRLRGEVDPSRVAWVSMGAFRFTGKLARIIRERFPTSGLLAGEFERCGDGKFRYPEAFRSSAYRVIYEALRSWSDEFPVYLCMESPSVWETVTGSTPPPARSLSALLDDRARHLALSNRAK